MVVARGRPMHDSACQQRTDGFAAVVSHRGWGGLAAGSLAARGRPTRRLGRRGGPGSRAPPAAGHLRLCDARATRKGSPWMRLDSISSARPSPRPPPGGGLLRLLAAGPLAAGWATRLGTSSAAKRRPKLRSVQPEIVGGHPVREGEFPFMAFIEINTGAGFH